jgi:transcriptional regulator with GAF, ATPase, and Fis domain
MEASAETWSILGLSEAEGDMDHFLSVVHPEDREHLIEKLGKKGSLDKGDAALATYRIVTPDGIVRHVEAQASLDEHDGESRIIGTLQDVTRYKSSEAALASALESLELVAERTSAENVYLRKQVGRLGFDDLVGNSASFDGCLTLIEQVAPTDLPVLVLGETGTGKELIAQAVHASSTRSDGPMVCVNCAALPETLIESELFGHEKGSFTGATGRRRGRFELADGGTLFLDEIGDIPAPLQSKLLRVLQEGEIERVGGSIAIKVDVRIIAATHRDLVAATETGDFRSDLYYRINAFPINVPPLRERGDDVQLLARHFAQTHAERMGRSAPELSPGALERLSSYSWPGNVRELENVIQRALIVSPGDLLELFEFAPAPVPSTGSGSSTGSARSLEAVERQHIRATLSDCKWVIEGASGAAAALGLSPSTLRSRMKKLGIERATN